MLLVGLTGGIGSGKSTVAAHFAELGAVVVDADALAREVVEPGGPAYDAVVERFGEQVVGPDGALDRAAIAEIVFADEGARRDLEAITHPAVGEAFADRVRGLPDDAIVVMDVPLLVEAKQRAYDVVVVVEAPRALRLERLEARGLARADAEARMVNQATDAQRRAVADHVVDNGGSLEDLRAQVDRVWEALVDTATEKARGSAEPGEPRG